MRILFAETHYQGLFEDRTSGIDYWRLLNPAKWLKENTDHTISTSKGIQDFEFVANNYDIVWTSYIRDPMVFSALMVLEEKYGVKWVMDIDDNVLHVPEFAPAAKEAKKNPELWRDFGMILKEAPRVTVSTKALLDLYNDYRRQGVIAKLPNGIDLNVYSQQEKINDNIITIGYFGSTSHYVDFEFTGVSYALAYLLGKYPNVRFKALGNFLPVTLKTLPGIQIEMGDRDFFDFQKEYLEWIRDVDIAICPLDQNLFNAGKSAIKFYEFSSQKVPVVMTKYGPYRDLGNYVYAHDTKDWIERLEELILDRELRNKIAQEQYEDVKGNHTIEQVGPLYAQFIERI